MLVQMTSRLLKICDDPELHEVKHEALVELAADRETVCRIIGEHHLRNKPRNASQSTSKLIHNDRGRNYSQFRDLAKYLQSKLWRKGMIFDEEKQNKAFERQLKKIPGLLLSQKFIRKYKSLKQLEVKQSQITRRYLSERKMVDRLMQFGNRKKRGSLTLTLSDKQLPKKGETYATTGTSHKSKVFQLSREAAFKPQSNRPKFFRKANF